MWCGAKSAKICWVIYHILNTNIKCDETQVNVIVTNTETTETYVDYDNIDSDDDIDENIFPCDQCEHTFESKSSLSKHVKLVNKKNEEKLLKRKCDNSNSSSRKKSKEETFSCEDCVFKTNTKNPSQSTKKTHVN